MNAIQAHIVGIRITFETLLKGHFLIYFLPGLILGLLFFGLFSFTGIVSQSANSLNDVPLIGGVIAGITKGLLSGVDFILNQIFLFFILVLFSPFNCLLSEKMDNHITNNSFDGGIARIINDIFRALLIVFFALIMEFFFIAIWWFFSWILGLSALDSTVYFIIGAFFIGFAFYDYSLERYKIGAFSSWGFAFSNPIMMIMSGTLFLLTFMIPYIGIVIAPVLLTMISTVIYIQRFSNKQ